MTIRVTSATLAVALASASAALAEEGMWTFDNFPSARVQEAHGFAPDGRWLDRVRASSIRLSSGCSASFVSPSGLILTNWHCVSDCLQNLSTPADDLQRNGFTARARAEERSCPGVQANVLTDITDVTAAVRRAADAVAIADQPKARDAAIAEIEANACRGAKDRQCEVVSLYRGGQYKLYTYKIYPEVRLVFAPEMAIGFFGGDPDNFNFPRYNLDAAFLRAYERGRPARTRAFLPWRSEPLAPGELTFVSGHPGSTQRLLTMDQLGFVRDWEIPVRQLVRAQLRGRLYELAHGDAEAKRATADLIFSVENSYKAFYGQGRALADAQFMAAKAEEEAALKAAVAARPDLAAEIGDPWADLAAVVAAQEALFLEHDFLEARAGSVSPLYQWAKALVRAAEERAKPNAERLPDFTDSRLAELEQQMLAPVPAPPAVDRIGLTLWLQQTREFLTVDHPAVQALLGKDTPEGLAERLVAGSKLADPAVRKALWEGGAAAIAASDDPLIRFVAANDARARAVREAWRTRVTAPTAAAAERLARARFAIYGDSIYPDATFSLRLSYGTVAGWTAGDRAIAPFTTMAGLYERATGAEPFALPERWLAARSKLDLDTQFNVSTTHDIIGGNSGSPVIDRQGRVAGAIFDGNILSLGGAFGYDGRVNRAVSVATPAITEALREVYEMDALVAELEAGAR